ncbi:hypothetical protein Zmor_002014 [Zophobas morio]|uniref:Uncharacterized protein n=1 Tax=Zophobas morio TaxID=2755281 RepID=A0AA38MT84_9CUCU|nr:hypothetical protein Zmor_002014 [Zophobas morio]
MVKNSLAPFPTIILASIEDSIPVSSVVSARLSRINPCPGYSNRGFRPAKICFVVVAKEQYMLKYTMKSESSSDFISLSIVLSALEKAKPCSVLLVLFCMNHSIGVVKLLIFT